MELKRDEIVKALERDIRISIDLNYECPRITYSKLRDALALIEELTEENESLKQAMEHEHASFMETFGEYGKKCEELIKEVAKRETEYNELYELTTDEIKSLYADKAKLTEENERLKNQITFQVVLPDEKMEEIKNECLKRVELDVRECRVDTVQNMRSRIKARCIAGGIYPAFVENVIDQITKEMLEGEK